MVRPNNTIKRYRSLSRIQSLIFLVPCVAVVAFFFFPILIRCGPCKLIAPILEECAQSTEFRDRVVFGKFDVEDPRAKEVKLELLLQGVMPKALPSLLLIQHNQVVATWNGVINTWELHDFLHPHVDNVVPSKGPTNQKNIDIRKMTSQPKNKESFTAPAPKPFRGIGLAYDF